MFNLHLTMSLYAQSLSLSATFFHSLAYTSNGIYSGFTHTYGLDRSDNDVFAHFKAKCLSAKCLQIMLHRIVTRTEEEEAEDKKIELRNVKIYLKSTFFT